jgi:hypothetical protein
MNRRIAVVALITTSLFGGGSALGWPQHGTAESGYWPIGYGGDTFTGFVTSLDDTSRTVTLTYVRPKDGKTETLTGSIEEGYTAKWKDGSLHQIKPSDIPIGTRLKVYYMAKQTKVEGKKVKSISIFEIAGVPNVKSRYEAFQPH